MVELLTVSVLFNVFLLYKLFVIASRYVKMTNLLFNISRGKATIKFDGEELEIKNT